MLKKLLIAFVILLALAWAAYRGIQNYISQKIIIAISEEAKKSGYSFTSKGGKIYPIGMYLEGVSFIPPPSKFPVPLQIERIEVNSPLEPLLRKVPQLAFNALLYGGLLQGSFDMSSDYQKVTLSGSATNLNLALHPMIGILGIEAAKISLSTPGIEMVSGGAALGKLRFEIGEFRKPTPTVLPQGVRLPAVGSLTGHAVFSLSQTQYEVSDIMIESDLGTVKSAFLRVNLATPKDRSPLSGTLAVDLTAAGDKEFETWIRTLFPEQPYSSSFSITFEGTAGRPNIKMTAR